MHEADLRSHLSHQTQLRIGLYDILRLQSTDASGDFDPADAFDCDALLFDVLLPEHLPKIGSMLDRVAKQRTPSFMVGSSGIEYALTQFWEAKKGTQRTSQSEMELMIQLALERLELGVNLILHTSRGSNDPRIALAIATMRAMGLSELEIRLQSGRLLGPKLGQILSRILSERWFSRVGVAGGDTSGHIARELNLAALEAIAPVAPGSPLCRAHATNSLDGVEFFFKGGQVGRDDVWGTMLGGTSVGQAASLS